MKDRCEVYVVSAVGNDPWGVLIEKELTERGLLFEGHLPVEESLPTGIVDRTKDERGVNRYDIKQGAWDDIDLPVRPSGPADRPTRRKRRVF